MAKSDLEKQYEKEQQLIKDEIEKKTGRTTERLYEEKEKRVSDAIALKEPDRVPLAINVNISLYTGIQNSAAYYDPIGWKRAMRKITVDMDPDMGNAGLPTSGAAMEILGVKNRLWPGGPPPPDYEYQFIEGEYTKADDSDLFLSDNPDFRMRRSLPRVFGALLPLAKLPSPSLLVNGF